MTRLSETLTDMTAAAVVEMLDTGFPLMVWTSQHLQDGNYEKAVGSFDKFVVAVREAAAQMKDIRAALAASAAEGSAAAKYRRDRTVISPRRREPDRVEAR